MTDDSLSIEEINFQITEALESIGFKQESSQSNVNNVNFVKKIDGGIISCWTYLAVNTGDIQIIPIIDGPIPRHKSYVKNYRIFRVIINSNPEITKVAVKCLVYIIENLEDVSLSIGDTTARVFLPRIENNKITYDIIDLLNPNIYYSYDPEYNQINVCEMNKKNYGRKIKKSNGEKNQADKAKK